MEQSSEDRAPEQEKAQRRRPEKQLSPGAVAQASMQYIAELTGKEVSGVTSLEPAEGGWLVGVEVVEDRRIPSSADLMALYEAEIGLDGALLAYRRTQRYARGRGDS